MSIVKMKRLRLLSLTSERDLLLARLQRAGCVEVTEPEEPQSMPEWGSLLRRDSTALLTVKSQATTVRTALENVNRYAAVRSGLFIQREAIREQDFFRQETMEEALALAEKIMMMARTSPDEIMYDVYIGGIGYTMPEFYNDIYNWCLFWKV